MTFSQLVGTKRVGKLPKVHFEERRNGMNILPDSFVLNQSWNAVLVKSIPMEKKKKKKVNKIKASRGNKNKT